MSLKGAPIQRKISVEYISFSAHVDYAQNSEFIEAVKAQHVVSTLFFRGIDEFMENLHIYRCSSMVSRLPWAVSALQCRPASRNGTKMLKYIHHGTWNRFSFHSAGSVWQR